MAEPSIDVVAKERFLARRKLREALLKKETAAEQLTARLYGRLDTIQAYLEDDEVWFEKLSKANLRDVAIMEGVWIDKIQLLTGKAQPLMTPPHQEKIDQVLPLLLQALQQRGLTIGLSERTIEVKT